MTITIEFYHILNDDNSVVYCAYIGNLGGSGISVKAKTPQELAEKITPYLEDFSIEEQDDII